MAKNKYSYSDSQNTSILTNIFNNVTKKNTDEVNSVLDPLEEKTNDKKTNIYATEAKVEPNIEKESSFEPESIAKNFTKNIDNTVVVPVVNDTEKTNVKIQFEDSSSELEVNKTKIADNAFLKDNLMKDDFKVKSDVKIDDFAINKNNFDSSKVNVLNDKVVPIAKEVKTDVEGDIIKHNNDIHTMFERINNNVKEATDIFNQNISMRNQLVKDFEQLESDKLNSVKEKADFERHMNDEYKRMNQKKDEQELKLNESKKILEREIEKLNLNNQKLEQERNIFETKRNEEYHRFNQYKEKEQQMVNKVRNDLDKEKEQLESRINELEEEKRRFKISQVKLDNERNELTINLNKFNELVNNFTFGISRLPNE